MLWFSNYVDSVRKLKNHPELGAAWALKLSVINLPYLFQLVLPFLVLVAAILFIRNLNATNELDILHTSGISIWKVFRWVTPGIVVLGYAVIVVVSTLTYEGKEDGNSNTISSFDNSYFWILSKTKNRNTIIKATHAEVEDQSIMLNNLVVFITKEGRLTTRIDSDRAEITNNTLVMHDVEVKNIQNMFPYKRAQLSLPINVGVKNLQNIVLEPEQIKIWHLPGFIKNLERLGLNSNKYKVYFYSLVAYPIDLLSMFLLGCALVLRQSKRASNIRMIIVGIVVGFTIHFFMDVITALGTSGLIAPLFTVLGSCCLLTSIALLLILYKEGL